jgi:hypothetical protein
MKLLKKIILNIYLDVISIPGLFMSQKLNAKYHLKFICPKCSKHRRKFRDVLHTGNCWWEANWKKEIYNIPKNFGILNWTKSYFGIDTDLTNFQYTEYNKNSK